MPEPELDGEETRPVVISDPKAVRALAHPARVSALDELYGSHSTRTATELAESTGLTPSAMSYHLRALEKFGLVERAPDGEDGRERRWRAAGSSLSVDSSAGAGPASISAYTDMNLGQFRERLAKEIDYRDQQSSAGRPRADLPFMTYGLVYLDERTEREFQQRVHELAEEYEERSRRLVGGPDPLRRTYYMLSVLPDRSAPSQG